MDFVESPSQMLEEFMWDEDILREISSNFLTGEPLPDQLIQNLIRSKNVGIGTMKVRQILLGINNHLFR